MSELTPAAEAVILGDGRAYDAACKRTLSQKQILARIMKECVREYRKCTPEEIERLIEGEPEVANVCVMPDMTNSQVIKGMRTEDSTLTEGTVTYDIRFRAKLPGSKKNLALIINVEAQNDPTPGYPLVKRAIFYCCRLISAQYGQEFSGSHYEKIKKVYSIWICPNAPEYKQNTITRYVIREQHPFGKVRVREKLANYDLMNVTMICLGEDKPGEGSDLIQLLNTILISQEPVEKKLEVMSKRFGIAVNETMEAEMENMGSLSQAIAEKNYNQGLEQGRTEGRTEGRAEGRAEGRTEGRAEGRAEEREKVRAEREDGIRNLVIAMSEENPSDKIAKYLVKVFSLSPSEAKKKVRMYMPKK